MSQGRCLRVSHKPTKPYSVILENWKGGLDEILLFEAGIVTPLKNDEKIASLKSQYTRVAEVYGCLGVLELHVQENTLSYMACVTGCSSVGKISHSEVHRITDVQLFPLWMPLPQNVQGYGFESVNEIVKMLKGGMFYFASTEKNMENEVHDISLCAQKQRIASKSDQRFFWNNNLHVHLRRFGIDTNKWLLRCMCGGINIKTIYCGARVAKACLISRLSCERMGTRFNVRGVNDDGHVANFVETEMVIYLDEYVVSYVQTRGSVPLFWEQPGVQVGAHKVRLSRCTEATAPAFDRFGFTFMKYAFDMNG